jgi:AAHS family 4-hydroxybenzoate transporter-like MFS transporter
MTAAERVDVQDVIDSSPLSSLQYLVVSLCFLIVFFDGYDTAVIAFVAPVLSTAWNVPPPQLRPLLTAALFGLAVGALTAGPLADRYGRKSVLIGAVIVFGVLSLLSAFTGSLTGLTIVRFLSGLGLGAAMPNATTLTAEYSPARNRSLLVTIMFCGFTLGSASAGFLASVLIPSFGWQSAFVLGGIVPLVLAVALIAFLPESLQFLTVKGRDGGARTARILARIAPGRRITADMSFVVPDVARTKGAYVRLLFQGGLASGTLSLWTAYFMGLLVIFLIRSWLPTLVTIAGFSIERASALGGMFDIGGTIGAILVAWCMDRYGPHAAIATSFFLGAGTIGLVARSLDSPSLLMMMIFVAGFFLSGAQTALSPLAAAFYPTSGRATGVAWMLGIGRFGGILGAFSGGVLLSLGWDFRAILTALAIPAALAAIAVALKGRRYAVAPEPPVLVGVGVKDGSVGRL